MIDEKKLIKNLKKEWEELADCSENLETLLDYVIRFIKGQPKTGEWIPCSERLPDKDGTYLVTRPNFGNRITDTMYFCRGSFTDEHVISWQPLPEPYHEP